MTLCQELEETCKKLIKKNLDESVESLLETCEESLEFEVAVFFQRTLQIEEQMAKILSQFGYDDPAQINAASAYLRNLAISMINDMPRSGSIVIATKRLLESNNGGMDAEDKK